jgi:hypothetical protein
VEVRPVHEDRAIRHEPEKADLTELASDLGNYCGGIGQVETELAGLPQEARIVVRYNVCEVEWLHGRKITRLANG